MDRSRPLHSGDEIPSSRAKRAFRVLVIGSDIDTLSMIEAIAFDRTCLSVQASAAITDGVFRLERTAFDAVILELPSPDEEAWRALHAVREAAPQVALIVLTESPDTALGAIERGADDYLIRSGFDESLCLRVLRHALERKASESTLRNCLEVQTHLYERLEVGLFELGLDGTLSGANDAFRHMLGLGDDKREIDLRRHMYRGRQHLEVWLDRIRQARGVFRGQLAFKTHDGSERVGMTYVRAFHDGLGRKVGYRGAVMDITDVAQRAEVLPYEASHDLDTGLYNSRMFERELKRGLERLPEDGAIAVCAIKIQLGECESLYGKDFARELVKCLSVILKDSLSRDEAVARLDEETFCTSFHTDTSATALERACRIVERIKAFRFDWAGDAFHAETSAGVTFVNDPSCHAEAVLAAAVNGCEIARAEGRAASLVRPGPRVSRQDVEGMRWSARLKSARDENALVLHFQPILPLGRSEGGRRRYDVLVRYAGIDGKLYSPASFMSAVRQYNLEATLDLSVLEALFRSDAYCQREGRVPWFVVRLSDGAFSEPRFPERLRARVEAACSPRRLLCFAIRQQAVYENALAVRRLAAALKTLGCELMLEQFGEPLSMSTLRDLKPSYVRLSPSLIRGIATDKVKRGFVQALVGVAGVTGARVVACKVEDPAVAPILERCGVDYVQGLAFGEPCPVLQPRSGKQH